MASLMLCNWRDARDVLKKLYSYRSKLQKHEKLGAFASEGVEHVAI